MSLPRLLLTCVGNSNLPGWACGGREEAPVVCLHKGDQGGGGQDVGRGMFKERRERLESTQQLTCNSTAGPEMPSVVTPRLGQHTVRPTAMRTLRQAAPSWDDIPIGCSFRDLRAGSSGTARSRTKHVHINTCTCRGAQSPPRPPPTTAKGSGRSCGILRRAANAEGKLRFKGGGAPGQGIGESVLPVLVLQLLQPHTTASTCH